MQNSSVLTRMTSNASINEGSTKSVAPNSDANSARSSKPPVKRVINKIKKTAGILANRNMCNKYNNNSGDSRPTTPTPISTSAPPQAPMPIRTSAPTNDLEHVLSTTSLGSRRTEADSEEMPHKLRTKFTRPRLNQLTEQRIQRLRNSVTEAGNAAQVNMPSPQARSKKKDGKHPSQTSVSLHSQQCVLESKPCPQPLVALQKQLEDMQTEFMQKVASFREQGYGYAYKLVTVKHNDSCQVLVHQDDLLGLPKYLPEKSLNDFKDLCHGVFKAGFKFIFEQVASVQMSKDEQTADARREDLRVKLKEELDHNMMIVDQELMQLCSAAAKEESSGLMQQVCDLSEANNQLKSTNTKLDQDIAEVRKSREELKRLLDQAQKRNHDLGLELASKNISLVEQVGAIDDLSLEMKHLQKTNKNMQQRIKDNDANVEASKKLVKQHAERIEDLDDQLKQVQADYLCLQKKTDELNLIVADKDRLIEEQKLQLTELETKVSQATQTAQMKATTNWQEERMLISEHQAELSRLRAQLQAQEQVEQTLREEVEQKQEALRKAELRLSRLEEQIEHHRQVLAVRGERINYLDQEMKQREQESNRKINDIMAQTSDKNTLITQITNELASTNEQFQNLCATLSMKQTKLHSQEHVIKLLEESNARSVKLHTKLGEKNALLKDELDHLRRTVNNLMLGSEVSDMEVADRLLE